MYDRDASWFGLLAVCDVLDLWPSLQLVPVRGHDLGFHNETEGVEKLTALLDKFMHDSKMHAVVFVQRPYSLTVAFGCGRAVILDSHAHQAASCQRGALVAVHGSTASIADIRTAL